ncbi:MAG: cupin domain-containing protein [Methanomassiliicoccaceae archaeon]|nr:cupin domain-containing protein [Methanomassiliicoccaceae archaeon]
MEKLIKNIEHSTVLPLADQVDYLTGQVVSKTLSQNSRLSLTLFAFDKGEEISSHKSGGDAMVFALDGTGKITIDEKEYLLRKGESIVMPAQIPHAVFAQERFKMLLIVSFPEKTDDRVKLKL